MTTFTITQAEAITRVESLLHRMSQSLDQGHQANAAYMSKQAMRLCREHGLTAERVGPFAWVATVDTSDDEDTQGEDTQEATEATDVATQEDADASALATLPPMADLPPAELDRLAARYMAPRPSPLALAIARVEQAEQDEAIQADEAELGMLATLDAHELAAA